MITLNHGGIYGAHQQCVSPKLKQLGLDIAAMLSTERLSVSQVEEVLGEVERIVYHSVRLSALKRTQPRPEETPDEAEA